MLRNNLIEAFLQGQKLSLDAVQETPVHIQPAGERERADRVCEVNTLKTQMSHADMDSVASCVCVRVCVVSLHT